MGKKIEDKMSELVGGVFTIETKDETEFQLKPVEQDKIDLLVNYKKSSEKDIYYANKVKQGTLTLEDEKQREQFNLEQAKFQNMIIKRILKNSYPHWSDEQIQAVMQRYDTELLELVYECYGWVDKEVKEMQKKAILNELKKLTGEVTNPVDQKHEKKN